MLLLISAALAATAQTPPSITIHEGPDRMPPSYAEHRSVYVCNGVGSETRLVQTPGILRMRSATVGRRNATAQELAIINRALEPTKELQFTSLSCPRSVQMLEIHGFARGAAMPTERFVTLFLSADRLIAITVNGVEWYRAAPTASRP